jgi:hypothetical protein
MGICTRVCVCVCVCVRARARACKGVFYDATNILPTKRQMTGLLMNGKLGNDLEGRGCSLTDVLSRNLSGGTESPDSRCFGRDSNRAPPKYKSRTVLLR